VRINIDNKSIDIESRDINFILDNYAVTYKFHTKNAAIDRIIIPMFETAKTRYGEIKIEFVPDTSAVAIDIAEDGKAVEEIVPEQADELAVQDAKKEQVMKSVTADSKTENVVATPIARIPKQPSGPIIPPGSGGLNLPSRDPNDLRHTKADLMPEKDIDESKQKNISVSKDDSGNKRIA
jgi:hypothetical protein